MIAGVAGGVAGAAAEKLNVSVCEETFSSGGGEKEGSTRCGGRGNRDSENDEGVFVLGASLQRGSSVKRLTREGGSAWGRWVD